MSTRISDALDPHMKLRHDTQASHMAVGPCPGQHKRPLQVRLTGQKHASCRRADRCGMDCAQPSSGKGPSTIYTARHPQSVTLSPSCAILSRHGVRISEPKQPMSEYPRSARRDIRWRRVGLALLLTISKYDQEVRSPVLICTAHIVQQQVTRRSPCSRHSPSICPFKTVV